MRQATLALQLDIPAFAGRDALRRFAAEQMLAVYRAEHPRSRAQSIVVKRLERHARQWWDCIACGARSQEWSSATNPPPKWSQTWRNAHMTKHADAWLAERGYVVPGEDRELDAVLNDALVEAFGKLWSVR